MKLIDTHSHIYLDEFETDRDVMLARAREAGVEMILMPAIDSGTNEAMRRLALGHPFCRLMAGLHPCSVAADFKKELALVEGHLNKDEICAVGEIGLDFYWDQTFREQQFEAFEAQIRWAMKHDLPIVIHSRNATDACIEVVRRYPGVRGVFHCFSGDLEQAKEVIALGLFLGIGGVVTFKNGGLDKVLPHLSINHIVLETDAPYLAPVPYRGKRNEPAYLPLVAGRVAELMNLAVEEVAELTTANAVELFGLKAV